MKRKWLTLCVLTVAHFVATAYAVLWLFAGAGAALTGIDGEPPLWVSVYLVVLALPFGWVFDVLLLWTGLVLGSYGTVELFRVTSRSSATAPLG